MKFYIKKKCFFAFNDRDFPYFQPMKKLLLIAALAVAATNSYAQDCSAMISAAGGVKTQLQKASSESADETVTAPLWLSRDNNGYYLHISPVVKKDNKAVNIKGLPGERVQLTFVDGNAFSSQLIKNTGSEVIIMLSQEIINMLNLMQIENISWYENNAMQPSLQLMLNDEANHKLMQSLSCMAH
jgi:hypothetical protein